MEPAADEPVRDSTHPGDERYRLLVEAVKDYAIFLLDPEGRVVTWNVGAERIKGYTAGEIVGKHFSVFFPPEDAAAGKPQQELETAANEERFVGEGWRLRKDGSRFWANVVLTALRDEGGQLIGFAKVTRDLTERRAAEEQARELVRSQAAHTAAEAASKRKDQYLAMLAHELRNPLAPLLTGLSILRQAGDNPQVRERVLDLMERQTRHLKRLVDDSLEAARFNHGKVQIRRERIDLARVVRATAEDRRPMLEQAGLALSIDVPETPVWMNGDVMRLAQVVTNLLDNAEKFTERGGRVAVRLSLAPDTGEASLSIEDTGIGIDAQTLSQVFESFSQADRSLVRTRGGLGLGLSVVKGLVGLHGGRVEATSPGLGCGAIFTVQFPVQSEPPALSGSAVTTRKTKGARSCLRVLVIEDNHDAADSMRLLLEALGHEVQVAYAGPEGVETATAWQPDVVVSDIGLPGLDGYHVAEALRNSPATADVRLIAVSGYGQEEDIRRARAAGFDEYLVKPAPPEELELLLCSNATRGGRG
jgi:PAS domain S-box-containing protein